MKKNIIPIVLALTSSMANAEYIIKAPLEQAQGGHLTNGSILFINQPTAPIENWVAIKPLLSDWYTIGEPFDCQPDGWVPEPSTIAEGEVFTQTNQWCYIRGERTVQSREQETTTGIIRNVGDAEIEIWNLDASDTRNSIGTLSAWEQFADAQNPKLSKNWNDLSWAHKGLSYIPNEPYPITIVNNGIKLNNNQLTNVAGLSNLTIVANLNLSNNKLTNVDDLSNLTSVYTLGLINNQLTNVAGLSKLTTVHTLGLNKNKLTNVNELSNLTSVYDLWLNENQLTNVDGLANVKVFHEILVDATYSGPKLPANTRFCTENKDSVFVFRPGFAIKSKLCESP